MEKNRIVALHQDAYLRSNFNEPRLLHLPMCVFQQKLLYILTPLYLFGTVLQSYLRGCLPGDGPQ